MKTDKTNDELSLLLMVSKVK